jgi:hypothetical protein
MLGLLLCCDGWIGRNALTDCADQVLLHSLPGHAHRALDGDGIGPAMADDYHPIHTEQSSPAVFAVVQAAAHLLKSGLGQEPAEHGQRPALDFGFDEIEKESDHTLVLKADGEGIERARQVVSGFGRRAWVGRGQLWLSLQGQERNEWQEMLLALLSALQPGQPWRAESA